MEDLLKRRAGETLRLLAGLKAELEARSENRFAIGDLLISN